MLRALILDFGGVLTISVREWIGAYCASHGGGPEGFRAAAMDDGHVRNAHHLLERGEIDERTFEPLLGEALGLDDHEGLVERLIEQMVLDQAMIEAIRAARRHG